MNIYWTYKSFPELRRLQPIQRRAAWRACYFRPLRHWQTWAALLGAVVIIVAGGFLGSVIDGQTGTWLGRPLTISQAMRAPVAALTLINVGGIVGFMVALQVYCRMIRPYLKLYVDSHQTAKQNIAGD